MSIDKQALREAAEKATPGPWGIARNGKTITSNQSHPVAVITEAFHRMLANGKTGGDAEFIASANPATVIALLDELEAAEKRIAQLIHIINMHTVELGFGEKPITMAELIIAREGSGSDVLAAIRAAGITVKGE